MRLSFTVLASLLSLWISLTTARSMVVPEDEDRHHQPSPPSPPQEPILPPEFAVPGLKNIFQLRNLSSIIADSPLLTLHRAICEVESISNNELAVAKLLVSYLEAHNFTVTTQKVPQPEGSGLQDKARWNVFAVPDAMKFGFTEEVKGGPKVLLTSHIDTVPPFIPYALSYPPGKDVAFDRSALHISGRGTVDAKACVATQIYAVLELLSQSSISPADAALLFVVGEENSGSGMGAFSDSALNKALNYSSVIFGEPTELKLATGHKGIIMLSLTARGKACHSGYPWLGRNANSMLIPALAVLDQLGIIPVEEGGLPRSEKYGHTTVNVGLIRGGVAANVIPELATAKISFRLAGGTAEEAKRIIETAVRSVDAEEGLEMEFSQGYGPVPLDAGVEGFGEITVNYGTDVPNLSLEGREGVKRYLYGPGSILVAHGKDEGLSVGDMEEAVEGYKKLVLNALGRL